MKIWVVRSKEAWEEFQATGHLRGNIDFVERSFDLAYDWLIAEMTTRLGPPPPGVILPLWGWAQWSGERHKKPDLRARGYLLPGQEGVRLECEITDDKILLSDFMLWHHCLNYWYLPESEEDDRDFEAELVARRIELYAPPRQIPLPDAIMDRRIRASWSLIFELKRVEETEYIFAKPENRVIQATFWELNLADIKKVTLFMGK